MFSLIKHCDLFSMLWYGENKQFSRIAIAFKEESISIGAYKERFDADEREGQRKRR